jgi:hypothetical protein
METSIMFYQLIFLEEISHLTEKNKTSFELHIYSPSHPITALISYIYSNFILAH